MGIASEMMRGGLSAGAAKAINGQVATGISAAGSTLATATALVAGHNIVSTVSTDQGVALPNTEVGDEILVYNGTTTPLTVYPPTSSATINQLSAGVGAILGAYTACKYKKTSATTWHAWRSS